MIKYKFNRSLKVVIKFINGIYHFIFSVFIIIITEDINNEYLKDRFLRWRAFTLAWYFTLSKHNKQRVILIIEYYYKMYTQ